MFLHVGVLYLQQTDSNRQCNTGGAEGAFALRDRPRVSLELTEQVGEIHINSVHGLKEPEYEHKQTHLRQEKQNAVGRLCIFRRLPLTDKDTWEVLMLLHTCKKLQRPEVLVGDLVVLVLLASLNLASPETH